MESTVGSGIRRLRPIFPPPHFVGFNGAGLCPRVSPKPISSNAALRPWGGSGRNAISDGKSNSFETISACFGRLALVKRLRAQPSLCLCLFLWPCLAANRGFLFCFSVAQKPMGSCRKSRAMLRRLAQQSRVFLLFAQKPACGLRMARFFIRRRSSGKEWADRNGRARRAASRWLSSRHLFFPLGGSSGACLLIQARAFFPPQGPLSP